MKLEKETIITNVKRNAVYFTLICNSVLSQKEYEKFCDFMNRKVKLTLEVEEPILDDAERKYLSGVIRPFRNRIKCILKYNAMNKEWIIIKTNDFNMPFPQFKKGSMYKGMELNKEYSLEELGL